MLTLRTVNLEIFYVTRMFFSDLVISLMTFALVLSINYIYDYLQLVFRIISVALFNLTSQFSSAVTKGLLKIAMLIPQQATLQHLLFFVYSRIAFRIILEYSKMLHCTWHFLEAIFRIV